MNVPARLHPTWAVIPFKGRRGGKRRLAELLDADERRALAEAMLADVVAALAACPAIDEILVVTPDGVSPGDLDERRVRWLAEPPADGSSPAETLNDALAHAQRLAAESGVRHLLIVPADVPLLTSDDALAMFGSGTGPSSVVLAPDAAESGTNGLLLSPPDVLAPAFGPDSFRTHLTSAAERRVPSSIVRRLGLALDVDTPADLARLLELAPTGRTLATLQALAIERRLGQVLDPSRPAVRW